MPANYPANGNKNISCELKVDEQTSPLDKVNNTKRSIVASELKCFLYLKCCLTKYRQKNARLISQASRLYKIRIYSQKNSVRIKPARGESGVF